MAKHQGLIERLTRQLGAHDVKEPHTEAVKILRERGHVYKNSERLTTAGQKRQDMGPAGRAIDRAARQTGHAPRDFKYVPGKGARLK